MAVFKNVIPGVTLIRNSTAHRLKYEIEYNLKNGTTDNCYLLNAESVFAAPKGSEPAAERPVVLIDVPNEAYGPKFVEALSAQLGGLARLSKLLVTHLDPKAIPSLELLIRAWAAAGGAPGGLEVVLSNPALRLLQSSLGETPERAPLLRYLTLTVARSTLNVGMNEQGKVLLTPTPRWPDMLVVYLPEQQALLSGKLFGAHAAPGIVAGTQASCPSDAGGWQVYGEHWRHYFDCMLAPVARQAQAALERLDIVAAPPPRPAARVNTTSAYIKGLVGKWLGLAPTSDSPQRGAASAPPPEAAGDASVPLLVSYLLPLHGPLVVGAVQELVRDYRAWTDEQVKAASTACVSVMYASAYGNTAALAQAISRGITKGGVAVNMLNLELCGPDEVGQAVKESNGFILGSPTLGGHMPTQVLTALGAVMREPGAKEQPCGVFGSFGWSGEAVDEMEARLKNAGFAFAFDAVRVKFKPTAKDLIVCEESGRALAQSVRKKLKARELAAAPSRAVAASACQLAMGRVVGSLSVLTAVDEDAASAMLASWVSQASFNPPGVTVAVKKDRAMEPLLVVGGKFALSMVAEGRDRGVMKRLARPFGPGEDRLAGIETVPSDMLALPVLKDANSYMECQVVTRMEAGDHWLVYAQVLAGKVLDDVAPTAVHYRKVGNHY